MTLWCTHIFYISLFLKHTCIFTQQAHDVLMTLMQCCINVSLTSSWSHVPAGYLFIFTRHRQRGAIEMTLICAWSVLHSIRLSVRPIFFHYYNSSYIFHRADLKFYRMPSYHMKMCRWFLFFFGHFSQSYGPCWLIPCHGNSCHIFYRIDLKLSSSWSEDVHVILEFLVLLFLTKLRPFVIFGIFPTFEPLWPRKLNLASY